MAKTLATVLAFTFAIIYAAGLFADTYYVSPTGSDANAGDSEEATVCDGATCRRCDEGW